MLTTMWAMMAGLGALFLAPVLSKHRERLPAALQALWWAPQREGWISEARSEGHRRLLLLAVLAWALIAGLLRGSLALLVLGGFLHFLDQRGLKRWRRVQDDEIPEGLRALAADLNRGATLGQALSLQAKTDPGPLGPMWKRALAERELGRSLPQALEGMAARAKLRGLEQAALAMTIAERSGGRLAHALDEVADSVAALLALDGKLQALTAQGRLQLFVMAALPVVFAIYLGWTDPDGVALMLNTPQGMLVCSIIVSCEIVGVVLFRKVLGVTL